MQDTILAAQREVIAALQQQVLKACDNKLPADEINAATNALSTAVHATASLLAIPEAIS